jgi:four helix bundle protein
MEKRNIVLEKSFEFALIIIEFSEQLEQLKKFVIARQLLKSGTSIGTNISEAQSSESKADFIHKLKIASKEAEETKYWLMLCKLSPSYPFDDSILSKLDEIQKLLSTIISVSKHNAH